jgi:hypothetical protein
MEWLIAPKNRSPCAVEPYPPSVATLRDATQRTVQHLICSIIVLIWFNHNVASFKSFTTVPWNYRMDVVLLLKLGVMTRVVSIWVLYQMDLIGASHRFKLPRISKLCLSHPSESRTMSGVYFGYRYLCTETERKSTTRPTIERNPSLQTQCN